MGGCTQPPIFVGKNILENDKKYLTKQEKSARIRKRSTKAGQKPELEKKFAKTLKKFLTNVKSCAIMSKFAAASGCTL